jgi:hypothetical protein
MYLTAKHYAYPVTGKRQPTEEEQGQNKYYKLIIKIMYFALSNIKHNGNQYFRGDSVPELTEAQATKLVALGVASEKKPVGATPESNVSRVLTDEERRANRKASGKPHKVAPKSNKAPATDDKPGYAANTVNELKAILTERGLETTGNKADLVARLEEADKAPATDDDTAEKHANPDEL